MTGPTAVRRDTAGPTQIVLFDDDPGQLPMRSHVVRMAQERAGESIGAFATCPVVPCPTRKAVLAALAEGRPTLAFVDLESVTGDLRGARLIRSLAESAEHGQRTACVAMTAHNSFGILAALKDDVVAVLQSTSPALGDDAVAVLQHATDPERMGRRAFPRSHTVVGVRDIVGDRFLKHFGFRPRPGDLWIVANLAQGVADSVTNRELQAVEGSRVAVAQFKRSVKERRDVPVDSVASIAREFVAGDIKQTLFEPVRATTLDLATRAMGTPWARRASLLSEADLARAESALATWHRSLAGLDPRDQSGRQDRVTPTLDAITLDPEERDRVTFALHVLADTIAEAA